LKTKVLYVQAKIRNNLITIQQHLLRAIVIDPFGVLAEYQSGPGGIER
jgi:hypothetical protein